MNDVSKKIDPGAVVGGLVLLAMGLMFLLDELEVTSFGYLVRRYWPMILVAVGLPKLSSPRTIWSGLWLITLGAWMQACVLRIGGMTFGSSWPLLLIVAGAGTVLRAVIEGIAARTGERNHES